MSRFKIDHTAELADNSDMEPTPYEYITASFPQLWWAVGFYFSSITLVLLALLPTVCRAVAILASRKILNMGFNFGLEVVTIISRILLVGTVLVLGGAMSRADLFSFEGWVEVIGALGASVLLDPARIIIQFVVVIVLLFGAHFLLGFLLTEQRTADLLDRMQRKVTPWKVRRILLESVLNLLVLPISIAFAVRITELI